MKEKLSKKFMYLLFNFRTLLLILFLFSSFMFFNYDFSDDKKIAITNVGIGSLSSKMGFEVDTNSKLRDLEVIQTLNGDEVSSVLDFYNFLNSSINSSVLIETNKNSYFLERFTLSSNDSIEEAFGLSFRDKPKSNLKLGIELEGGSRIILDTNKTLNESEFSDLLLVLNQRLSKGGLSGTKAKKIEDVFSGEKFILIESTSSNKNYIFNLLEKQGNFEAYLGDEFAFNSNNIIKASISPNTFEGCSNSAPYICTYSFSFSIDDNGTNSFFDIASQSSVVSNQLSKRLAFYLDDSEIVNLSVSSVFKYQKISTPQITISGDYTDSISAARKSAIDEIEILKVILKTGPLPTELNIISSYSISSKLSNDFLSNAIFIGFLSLLIVSTTIAIRYKSPYIFAGVFVALVSEILIILGLSSLMSWAITIDLAAIGGLIAAIGTGVDDQIIITDEFFRKKNKSKKSKQKIKGAVLIILIAYLTTLAAMLPLSFTGLEVIKGFSTMIILGITIGVLITRPFYASYLRIMMTTKKQREEEEKED